MCDTKAACSCNGCWLLTWCHNRKEEKQAYVYKTNVLSNDVQWFYTRNSSEKKFCTSTAVLWETWSPLHRWNQGSPRSTDKQSPIFSTSVNAAVPDGNLDGLLGSHDGPALHSQLSSGRDHVRELHGKCLWPIDVKHSPGNSCLAWRSDFPGDDLAAVARCYAGQIQRLLAIALSQRQRLERHGVTWAGKKKPRVNLCGALTENTIYMLAASCGKHPPKLQTQHQHDFYLLPLARAHCHRQRQRHHDLRYRQHQQQPTAPAAAAPAPSSSGSGGAAAEGVAAPPPEPPPATASTRPAGPSTRPGPDQHQTWHHQHNSSTSTRATRTTTSQPKHRHNWPPAQTSASSDSKSKDMEVLKGGCLAKRKRKYRLVYRFCIVLGIVWEGAISWQDWAS